MLFSILFSLDRACLTDDGYTSTLTNLSLEYAAGLLRSGKGLGLICTPSSGSLSPFKQKVITVTVYSDLWGRYNDTLVCQVMENEDLKKTFNSIIMFEYFRAFLII